MEEAYLRVWLRCMASPRCLQPVDQSFWQLAQCQLSRKIEMWRQENLAASIVPTCSQLQEGFDTPLAAQLATGSTGTLLALSSRPPCTMAASMQCATAMQRVPAACGSSSAQRRTATLATPQALPAAASLCRTLQRHAGPQQQRQRRRLVVTAAVKIQKGKQILCNKTLKAKDGSAEAVQQLCSDVAAFSQQRMADRRSGVLAFEMSEVRVTRCGCPLLPARQVPAALIGHPMHALAVMSHHAPLAVPAFCAPCLESPCPQDDYEPGTFHFLELYASHKALTDHAAAPEFKRFVDKVGGRAAAAARRSTQNQGHPC